MEGKMVDKEDSGRVLVVDDEKWICESLKLLLSRHGLQIDSVQNGRDALASIESNIPDLIILDFNLPDINGLGILSKIREKRLGIPVIFMTGYGSETISIKAFKLGIADYFIKPFSPQKLVGRVLDILKKTNIDYLPEDDHPQHDETDPEIEISSDVGRAVNFIKNNYKYQISLDQVADIAGLSRFHFTRAFRKVMGMPFTAYLTHLRVRKAADALSRSDINISEVAFSAGFNSLRQFERAFKSVCGKSPGEYRCENSPDLASSKKM